MFPQDVLGEQEANEKQTIILDARAVNFVFTPPPGVSLCNSQSMCRIEVMIPDHLADGTLEWTAESLDFSLGVATYKFAFDDISWTVHFGVDTVRAEQTWKEQCSGPTHRLTSSGLVCRWAPLGVFTSSRSRTKKSCLRLFTRVGHPSFLTDPLPRSF